jgi:hypothetical protein
LVAAGTHQALLNRHDDFPKHFIISAALAATAGGSLSDAVGVYKEIEDSRGGSGFSFNDIAADRVGVHAAARLRAGIGEKDIMPMTDDLPEFMPEPESNGASAVSTRPRTKT